MSTILGINNRWNMITNAPCPSPQADTLMSCVVRKYCILYAVSSAHVNLFAQIYYVLAVVADLIFRSLWTLNISVGEAGAKVLEGNILGTVLAIIEVFRWVGQLSMGGFTTPNRAHQKVLCGLHPCSSCVGVKVHSCG